MASLETLLNLEASDKLDLRQRFSPPSRELLAQGAGNLVAGLIGGIPVTSVIVRSSVNINSGGKTKLSTIVHGILLLLSATLHTHLRAVERTVQLVRQRSDERPVRILVGGLAFDQAPHLAEQYGADGYARSADEALDLGRRWFAL